MKKTIITAVLCLSIGSGAHAATTYFNDLSQSITGTEESPLTFNRVDNGLSTITTTAPATASLYKANSGQQASSSITFTFNFSEYERYCATATDNYVAKITLAAISLCDSSGSGSSSRDAAISILRNSNANYEVWLDALDESGNATHSQHIGAPTSSFTSNGDKYITYTLVTGPMGASQSSDTVGWSVYGSDGSLLKNAYNYFSNGAAYQAVDSVLVNTTYVEAVAITPVSLTDTKTIASISKTQAAAIPEPATATLSLLALAGLAMHRRRK